jgi:hypothetical protein
MQDLFAQDAIYRGCDSRDQSRQADGASLNMVLHILLRVIAQTLQANNTGAYNSNNAALHFGVIAFIHRFGSSLNEHVHFYVCAVDGVFEEAPSDGGSDAAYQTSQPRIVVHLAIGIAGEVVAQAQASMRRRILRAYVGRG